jgi:hypothetical protein
MSPTRHHLIDTQWFLKIWCQSRELVEGVQALYPEPLPQAEAEEAARNLARFLKTRL